MSEPIPQQRDLSAEDLRMYDTPPGEEIPDISTSETENQLSSNLAEYVRDNQISQEKQQEIESRLNDGYSELQNRFGYEQLTAGDTYICRLRETPDGRFEFNYNGQWNEAGGTGDPRTLIQELQSGSKVEEGEKKNGGIVEVFLGKRKTAEGIEYVYVSQEYNGKKVESEMPDEIVNVDAAGPAATTESDSPADLTEHEPVINDVLSQERVAHEQSVSKYDSTITIGENRSPLTIQETAYTEMQSPLVQEVFTNDPQQENKDELPTAQENKLPIIPPEVQIVDTVSAPEVVTPKIESFSVPADAEQIDFGAFERPLLVEDQLLTQETETQITLKDAPAKYEEVKEEEKEVFNTKTIFTSTPEIRVQQREITTRDKNENEIRNLAPEQAVDVLHQSEIELVPYAEQVLTPSEQIHTLRTPDQGVIADRREMDAVIEFEGEIAGAVEPAEEALITPLETTEVSAESSPSLAEMNMVHEEIKPDVPIAVTAAEVAHLPLVEAPVAIDIFDRPSEQLRARALPDVPLITFFVDMPAATKQFEALRAPDSRPVEIVVVGEVAPDGAVLDATVVKAEAGEITYEFRAVPARQQPFSAAATRQMFEHYEWEADSRSELLFADQADPTLLFELRGARAEPEAARSGRQDSDDLARGAGILNVEPSGARRAAQEKVAAESLPGDARLQGIDLVIDTPKTPTLELEDTRRRPRLGSYSSDDSPDVAARGAGAAQAEAAETLAL